MSESNGYVTREQWLAPFQRKHKVLEIEGLGKVRIQNLTEAERQKVEAQNYRTKKGGGIAPNWDKYYDQNLRYIVAAVVDVNGTCIFTLADVDSLRQRDMKEITTLALGIAEHCGLTIDMEELEKNLEGSRPAASPTS